MYVGPNSISLWTCPTPRQSTRSGGVLYEYIRMLPTTSSSNNNIRPPAAPIKADRLAPLRSVSKHDIHITRFAPQHVDLGGIATTATTNQQRLYVGARYDRRPHVRQPVVDTLRVLYISFSLNEQPNAAQNFTITKS
eukprot:scaffold297236_cov17-Prasinocladus_malaysianus.AAC.1